MEIQQKMRLEQAEPLQPWLTETMLNIVWLSFVFEDPCKQVKNRSMINCVRFHVWKDKANTPEKFSFVDTDKLENFVLYVGLEKNMFGLSLAMNIAMAFAGLLE